GEPCWPVVRSTGGRTFCVRGFTCSVTPAELFSTGVSVIHRINELLQKDFRPPTFHRSWVRSLLRKGEHHGTGNREVVQRREGFRLHQRRRGRRGRLRTLLGYRRHRRVPQPHRGSASVLRGHPRCQGSAGIRRPSPVSGAPSATLDIDWPTRPTGGRDEHARHHECAGYLGGP